MLLVLVLLVLVLLVLRVLLVYVVGCCQTGDQVDTEALAGGVRGHLEGTHRTSTGPPAVSSPAAVLSVVLS